MDYSKLENVVVKVTDGLSVDEGLVVGCDPNIGVSIVENSDHSHYLLCLVGPSSPQVQSENITISPSNRKIFDTIAAGIKDGMIDTRKLFLMNKTEFCKINPEADCAFGQ